MTTSDDKAHESVAYLLRAYQAEIERLRALVQALLDNEPDDMAADGVTVLQVWRKEARRALEGK